MLIDKFEIKKIHCVCDKRRHEHRLFGIVCSSLKKYVLEMEKNAKC